MPENDQITENLRVSPKEIKELKSQIAELERCLKAVIKAVGKAEIATDTPLMDEGSYCGIKFE